MWTPQIETIGLDHRARPNDSVQAPLGTPVDKRKAGWYAAGPKPGSGMGTVLTNGHTFRDGSAIFHEDFAALVAVGQQIDLVLDNGTTCSYRISTEWRDVGAIQTTRGWSPVSACTTSRAQSGSSLQRAAALARKCPDVQGHQYRPGHPGAEPSLTARILRTSTPGMIKNPWPCRCRSPTSSMPESGMSHDTHPQVFTVRYEPRGSARDLTN